MMRWIAAVMVWISMLGSIALLAYCKPQTKLSDLIKYQSFFTGVYLTANNYSYYKNRHDYEDARNPLDKFFKKGDTWLGLLIVTSVILIILLLILIFLRKRIYLAIGLIEEGSKYVNIEFYTITLLKCSFI